LFVAFDLSTSWSCSGPIQFYTGNEGPIEVFYNNTGFLTDTAPEFNGVVVFAEHRYYGESLPFGKDSFLRHNLQYLTVEQALEDYAHLLLHLKERYNNAHVIAYGGSYGGFLAAFMRIKYPHIVDMSLAASAPIRTASRQMAPTTFFATVTNTFNLANPACPDLMRRGFSELLYQASLGDAGLAKLTEVFSLCKTISPEEVEHLVLWAVNAFTTLSMADYPYPADFLAPLPGYPVTYACTAALKQPDALSALAVVAGLPYNGTSGDMTCFDIFTEYYECADQSGCGTGPSGIAWDYQACSELTWEMDSNNVTDMFPPRSWTFDDLHKYCNETFGIAPRTYNLLEEYGSGNISTSATRIIFSNGLLDPWHTGGFLESLAPTLPAVIIQVIPFIVSVFDLSPIN
jgi:dipeptidyl-peptidase II